MNGTTLSEQSMFEKFYDKSFQQEVIDNPQILKKAFNFQNSEELEIVVKVSTKDTVYVAIPHSNQMLLNDVESVQAAGDTASTAGTAGSGSTAGSFSSCLSTASSVGSAGSIGSMKS